MSSFPKSMAIEGCNFFNFCIIKMPPLIYNISINTFHRSNKETIKYARKTRIDTK